MTTSFLFQGIAGRLAATSAAAFIGGIAGLAAAAPAAAVPAPTPRLVMGNATTCAEAGLSGTILFGSEAENPQPPQPSGTGTVTGGQSLDVTINAGWTASGVAVKGSPDTNVYDGPFVGPVTIEDMFAPITPGGPAGISHWFVCGGPSNGTPTPTPSGGAETGGGASFGFNMMGVGALAVAGGMGAVLFLRRRRDNSA